MTVDKGIRINAPHVIHETIDGETIILNLEKGAYYSLNDTGATLWAMVEHGFTKGDMVARAVGHFGAADNTIENAIGTFIDALTREQLVIPAPEGSTDTAQPDTASVNWQVDTFSAPELKKYTDMQDLLLLDPIHDVDDAGWPAAKNQ